MRTNPKSSQQGIMLLEALIGILIFSIGILAMLGMQAVGMRNTIDSKYRSEAAYLANQIVGTMWVDRGNIATYDDAGAGNARKTAWLNRVDSTLPQDPVDPTTTAPIIAVAGRQATITIRWKRPGDSTVSRYIVVAQINDPV
jgi:type IV pilus assembly protein PilV